MDNKLGKDMTIKLMFDQANSFYITAMLCERALKDSPRHDIYSTPMIVNLPLACEIYLKTLNLLVDGRGDKKHKLNELMDSLPDELRESILQSVYERFPCQKNRWGESYLDLISNTFTEWRYSYEKYQLSCEIGYLRALADSLKEECAHRIIGISWDEYIGINIDSR